MVFKTFFLIILTRIFVIKSVFTRFEKLVFIVIILKKDDGKKY